MFSRSKKEVQARDSRIRRWRNLLSVLAEPQNPIPRCITQSDVQRIIKGRESVGSPILSPFPSRNNLRRLSLLSSREDQRVSCRVMWSLPKYLLFHVNAQRSGLELPTRQRSCLRRRSARFR